MSVKLLETILRTALAGSMFGLLAWTAWLAIWFSSHPAT